MIGRDHMMVAHLYEPAHENTAVSQPWPPNSETGITEIIHTKGFLHFSTSMQKQSFLLFLVPVCCFCAALATVELGLSNTPFEMPGWMAWWLTGHGFASQQIGGLGLLPSISVAGAGMGGSWARQLASQWYLAVGCGSHGKVTVSGKGDVGARGNPNPWAQHYLCFLWSLAHYRLIFLVVTILMVTTLHVIWFWCHSLILIKKYVVHHSHLVNYSLANKVKDSDVKGGGKWYTVIVAAGIPKNAKFHWSNANS